MQSHKLNLREIRNAVVQMHSLPLIMKRNMAFFGSLMAFVKSQISGYLVNSKQIVVVDCAVKRRAFVMLAFFKLFGWVQH